MASSDEFFRAHPVFTREEYAQSRESASPRTVDSLLRKHVASGRVARVRRGLYVAPAAGASAETVDPFLVATKAAPDGAVSQHAALQFHGRAYSMWSQVTFLTTHATRGFRFGPIEYVPVRPPEQVVQLPDMGGGVDLDAVIGYALALDSAVTAARVGYFLSLHCERLFVEEAHLERLAAHAPKQARYLDTSRVPGAARSPVEPHRPRVGASRALGGGGVDEVRWQLLPMLRQDLRPDHDDVERWTSALIDETRALLGAVLPLTEDEARFLERLNGDAEIEATLLTTDSELQRRIEGSPGLRWKGVDVRSTPGSTSNLPVARGLHEEVDGGPRRGGVALYRAPGPASKR